MNKADDAEQQQCGKAGNSDDPPNAVMHLPDEKAAVFRFDGRHGFRLDPEEEEIARAHRAPVFQEKKQNPDGAVKDIEVVLSHGALRSRRGMPTENNAAASKKWPERHKIHSSDITDIF
ncbi:MAG: hypothetical protein K8R23_11040 [Chthoniobacter sp.]|nr:hypothetical protein [Chthoniobacter sp.]